MNPSDFKFTLYDIVSYTFCGAISLILFQFVVEIRGISFPETDFTKYIFTLISLESVVSFIIVSYFLGKIISAISSLVVEKIFLGWMIKKFYNADKIDGHILGNLSGFFNERFAKLYNNAKYNEKNWRLIITFVEENRPASYSTAFIFLSYYGMSRNLMLIFLVTSIFLMSTHFFLSLVFLIVFFIEIYEYFRFRKYYNKQIIFAFLNNKEGDNK